MAVQGGHIHRGSQVAVLETMPARAASDTGSRCSNRVVGATRSDQTVGGHDCLWLTHAVTGEDFPSYVQRMQRNGEWVDTAFMHDLACAFGVTVLVFQDSVDPAIIGPH